MSLEEEIAAYVVELEGVTTRISARKVRLRLMHMLRFPREDDSMSQDRILNDPLGLWGRTPGWRCWTGRHSQCEPLGADEACSCACGIGGHRHDQNGVRTEGCDCGHEGMGMAWHLRACRWRQTWMQAIEDAALKAGGEDTGD